MTTIDHPTILVPVEIGISYEAFLSRYAGQRAEWVAGEVFLMPPQSTRHDKLNWLTRTMIEAYLEIRPGGAVLDEFQSKLTPESPGREPDVIYVSEERLHLLKKSFFNGAPDLAVEIISPDSIERDRVTKFEEYRLAGVREYWLFDVLAQPNTATFYRLDEQGNYQVVELVDGWFISQVLSGLRFEPAWLLQEPAPLLSAILKYVDENIVP